MKKNAKRLLALLVCLPLLCGIIFFTAKEKKADAASSYTVTTSSTLQTFDGWGTSLIWWANNVGKYDWAAGSGDRTVREEIMELLYGKDGLEYNIARFNVGGGDNPNHSHVTAPQNMEGYASLDDFLPMYYGEGDANMYAEIADWKYYKDRWTMENDVTYAWETDPDYTNDAAQRWCMEWIYQNAEKLGTTNELITEYFSNSPPWFMTNAACSSGNVGGAPNLLAGRADDFAKYFVDVLLHLVKDKGYTFQYVDPFNESTSDWWPARSQKQEGCKFTDAERADVLYYLVKELDKHPELDHIKISFDDSTGADKAWDAYKKLRDNHTDIYNAIRPRLGKLNYHLYEGGADSRKNIANESKARGWQNWMSEMGYSSDKTADASTLQTGYKHTDMIRETIYQGANAYVLWQVIEELATQLANRELGYGPLKVSYYSAEEVTDLSNYGYDLGSYYVSRQYYMLGQYSKYIRPGYKILQTSDDKGVAAISPDSKKIVIVHSNNSTSGEEVSYDLGNVNITGAQVIVTDEDQSWAKSSLAASGNKFSYAVNPYSVTTFVLDIEPSVQVKTSVSIQEGKGYNSGNSSYVGGAFTKLSTGVALPAIETLAGADYLLNHFYLTDNWSAYKSGLDGASQWVQGNSSGSVGAFIKFKNTVKAEFVFKCKLDSATDAAKLKFELYEGTTKVDEATDLKAISEPSTSDAAKPKDEYKVVWTADDLDYTKQYAVRIIIADDGWTNMSRVDLYGVASAVTPASAIALKGATIKDGNLYVTVNDATAANEYKVCWREVGTTVVESETKTVSAMNAAVATGLKEGASYDVWLTDTAGVRHSEIVTVRNAKTDAKLLYYVDAGTLLPGSYSVYERAGANNTYKDQVYGADPITGKQWGITSTGNKKYAQGKVGTAYKALGDTVSTDGSSGNQIEYKFEVGTTGTFDIMLGVRQPWSARTETVSVNGTSVGTFTIDKENENFIVVTNCAPDASGYITVKVSKPTGETEGSLLGTIMIAKNGDTTAAFAAAAEWAEVTPSGAASNAKHYRTASAAFAYAAEVKITGVYVYNVDGTVTQKTEGITFDRYSIVSDIPNTEAARLTGVVDGLYFDTPLMLTSDASIYYFVDCASDGTDAEAGTPGTLQNGVLDQASSGGSWGYSGGSHSSGWEGGDYTNSKHYNITSGFHYTFTNLIKDESINIEVGGRSYSNWGDLAYEVYFGTNGTQYDGDGNVLLGEIDMPAGTMPTLKVKGIIVPAATCYMFFQPTKDRANVSFIKISSSGEAIPAAPVLSKSEAKRTDTITVSNLPINDLLVITADDGSVIKDMKITSTSLDVDLNTIGLPAWTQAVMFGVRHQGALETSVKAMLALPSVLVSGVKESWTDKMVLHFEPSMGVVLQKISVTAPSGRRTDVTTREYFNYVVRENGDHTVNFTTKENESYTQIVNIAAIDTITIHAAFNSAYTDGDVTVTVTFDCADGALDKFYIDDAETALTDNSCTIVASENKTYALKAVSKGGNVYTYELNVANIDRESAQYTVTPDYKLADGFTAALVAGNYSGGTFTVTKGENSYEAKNGLHLIEAGDYTVTYTTGTGKQASFTVKLGYGAGTLGSLNGSTLSGIAEGAKVYRLDVSGEEVAVTGGSCTLTAGYRYMIVKETDGNYEASIITVEAATKAAAPAPEKKGCGSAAGATSATAAIVLLLAGAALALAKKGGKRA